MNGNEICERTGRIYDDLKAGDEIWDVAARYGVTTAYIRKHFGNVIQEKKTVPRKFWDEWERTRKMLLKSGANLGKIRIVLEK